MITSAMIWEWIIKAVIICLAMTIGFAYVTLYERKVLARIQVRIGPNRAGPFGALQPWRTVSCLRKVAHRKEIFFVAPIITCSC